MQGWVWWREDSTEHPRWRFGKLTSENNALRFSPLAEDPASTSWIAPGFVDMHCHAGIGNAGGLSAEEITQAFEEELNAGVLLIREPGSPVDTAPANAALRGPHVIRSGRHLARFKRYDRDIAIDVEPRDLPEAVAQQAQQSDGWVKLVGDWIDRSDGADSDLKPLWPREALVDASVAARENGARLCVHAFSRDVIDDLLVAEVGSIEHGSGMTADHMREAVRRGIAVTPTLGQVLKFPEFAAAAQNRYPRYAQTMLSLFEGRRQWFENLVELQVHLLPGTDAGGYQPHGSSAAELGRWVEYGLPIASTFDFATWKAWDFLESKTLMPGAPADYLVFEGDPRQDQTLWGVPGQVHLHGERRR